MQASRRQLLLNAGNITTALLLNVTGAPALASAQSQQQALPIETSRRKLKVLVTGGHPGDPECGCGGTIARYTNLGHDVAVLYLNRGEGYCGGKPLEQCGAIRTAEAAKACSILKARPVFAAQYDGRAVVDNQRTEDFRKLFNAEQPDIIFAQWPIDRHADHRALSSLVLDAWLQTGQTATYYYYEVGEDTMAFAPNAFVDISEVEPLKRSAFYCHVSQGPERWYQLQRKISVFRGTESGYAQAEGFARHPQSRNNYPLPGSFPAP